MKRFALGTAALVSCVLVAPAYASARAPSPDGRIFYSVGPVLPDPDPSAGSQVWSVNPDGTDVRQLTHVAAPVQAGDPAVAPNGRQVLYVSNASGGYQVWLMRDDGTRQH